MPITINFSANSLFSAEVQEAFDKPENDPPSQGDYANGLAE